MPGAATSGQWPKCVARGGLARALSSALADLGGRATPVRGYYADLSNTRSTDRTAARTVVPHQVGFVKACEAQVGKMLLLRRSRH